MIPIKKSLMVLNPFQNCDFLNLEKLMTILNYGQRN